MGSHGFSERLREDERGATDKIGFFDAGIGLFLRRGAAWLVDYVMPTGLVSFFYLCANVFYLDEATQEQGNMMLLCAVLTLLLITVYVPWKTGRTIGERLFRLETVRRDRCPRSLLQVFVQECVLKVSCGPFVAVFYVLDYVVMGLLLHRDPDHDPTLDYFLKIRVLPVLNH